MKNNNYYCTMSFILGILSIIFYKLLVFQICSITFGIIGINKFNENKNKNIWLGVSGLIIGVIFLLYFIIFICDNDVFQIY